MDTIEYVVQKGLVDSGHTELPHHEAAKRGHVAIAEYFVEHGTARDVGIYTAARYGRTKLLQKFLDGENVATGALSQAAASGCTGTVRLLLGAGADMNEELPHRKGSSITWVEDIPIVWAIRMEHREMFELLVEHGADLKAPQTARKCIESARKEGLDSMLELLKAHGVDITM
jgi:ankyrin repeat protein